MHKKLSFIMHPLWILHILGIFRGYFLSNRQYRGKNHGDSCNGSFHVETITLLEIKKSIKVSEENTCLRHLKNEQKWLKF